MLNHNLEKLSNAIIVSQIHKKRMNEAYTRIIHLFPIQGEDYYSCSSEEIAFIDQYIFRFAKFQDIIGDKLFRLALSYVGEAIESLSFIDILNKSEKLGLITNKEDWMALRSVRNDVSHEYPALSVETTLALNRLVELKPLLERYHLTVLQFLTDKGYKLPATIDFPKS